MLDARRLSYLGLLVICSALVGEPARADSTVRAGPEGNGESISPSIGADGRCVAFESDASNLVAGDSNGVSDIFLVFLETNAIERVSVDSAGDQANGTSMEASVSADCRYVAFHSDATDLVGDDTNGVLDAFVHDRQSGVTERVSVLSGGGEGSGASGYPSISADGRFVAFFSEAEDLAVDSNGFLDVFVRDRLDEETVIVSVDSVGAQGSGDSGEPAISADGRFVSFTSEAANLVDIDTNGRDDVFVHDRQTGVTERVSVTRSGFQSNDDSGGSSISADGRFVAFESDATNLVGDDTNGFQDIFVRDRFDEDTVRVSVDSAGIQADARSEGVTISADGRFVAFSSDATNLVDGDDNGVGDVFVHDRLTGVTRRVSVSNAGGQGNSDSAFASISANGRVVSFASGATNLVAADGNGVADIFLRDQGLLPDGRNDFLADFGGAGLWQRLNNAVWEKIHNTSPQMVTSGDLEGSLRDEAIADFGKAGLWTRVDNSTWLKIHNASPADFVVGDLDGNGSDDLVADFGGAGLWVFRVLQSGQAWSRLHASDAMGLGVGDLDGNGRDELIVDFGASGLWVRYNDKTWVKRHNASPVHIATGDLDGNGRDELIADFGGGVGIWARYNNTIWTKLHNATSQGIATGDLDGNDKEELIADFGASGLWVRYNNATWVKRHNASPQRMIATDLDDNGKSELIADFGASGLWVRYNNSTWTKIHNATTQDLAAGGFD